MHQFDPRRRMIAGVGLAADVAIDTGGCKPLRDGRAQQQVIEPQPGVARPTVATPFHARSPRRTAP